MTIQELSKLYCDATIRMHELADDLYEELHTPGGTTVLDPEYINNKLNNSIRAYRSECDFVRSALTEFLEQNK